MGHANRLFGYMAGFTSASLFYILWIALQTASTGGNVSMLFRLGAGFFLWLVGGTGVALLLMALPWYIAVALRRRRNSLMYLSLFGAATTLFLGCVAASLAPKPLFVEDQTFLEGVMIAVQRQGICLLLTGLVFGATFWFVSERREKVDSVT